MREEARRSRSPSASSNQFSQMGRSVCPPQKSKNLNPVVLKELENLEKDADSRKSALKALKSYVKDLDTKAIPLFLAQVSETKEPGASFGEHTISLYEVLARVHGRNIVPQIDNIMSTIVKTLSSSAGSFPLHQACAKVVPAVARYGMDPSTEGEEKVRIIRSLCRPLSDALMGSPESLASGAALCLKGLVESDNWRFASDDVVNEVCLKVAGALEEKATQTNAHMGLVMALSKHNSLIVEAYARSLLRSGLKILTSGAAEANSQRRFSAIQMVNFLMKCVDSRSIASEIGAVMQVMDNCHTDKMPFVRGAAYEALQTARLVAAQKASKHERGSSPIPSPRFGNGDYRKWVGGSPGFASPESQTIDSFFADDSLIGSPLSAEQLDFNFGYGRRANRRLWNDETVGVDVSLKDGLSSESMSGTISSKQHYGDSELGDSVSGIVSSKQHSGVSELDSTTAEESGTFSGFPQANARDRVSQETASPHRSRPAISIDDVKMFTTPRKLIRSLQDPSDADSAYNKRQPGRVLNSPASDEVDWNPDNSIAGCGDSRHLDLEIEAKRKHGDMGKLNGVNTVHDDGDILEDSESVSSCGGIPTDTNCDVISDDVVHEGMVQTQSRCTGKRRYRKTFVALVCTLFLILATIGMLVLQLGNDEDSFDMVPT
ncbi:hypothetical protein Taro_037463 [Colocasia esculenta]|uniref:TORTIFOLIA1/SINE1-2 N-terminal domain-containing protein n=1 Tax=Colocasia esculenta TaxID=4460 RepID=A0A843WPS7_COLES|nr:hypothetical protein [Colocasia esculenta]